MVHLEELNGSIKFSFINDKGSISVVNLPIPESERWQWKTTSDKSRATPGFLSQNGDMVYRDKKKSWIGNYRIMEILHNNPSIVAKHPIIFGNHQPNKWYMDIETELVDGLSIDEMLRDPNEGDINARSEIRSVAFCNDNKMYIYGLIPLTDEQKSSLENQINNYFSDSNNYSGNHKPVNKKWEVSYVCFKDEYEMLKELMSVQIPSMPALFGWNFWKFDFNYLIRRCKQRYKMHKVVTDMSPTKTSYILSLPNKYNKDVKDRVELPNHKIIVDYMTIFEKWDTSVKLKSSMSLDFISNEVLGIKKVTYSGTLNELYERDFVKFLFYNAVDTILVQLIDEKCATFNTMINLANAGKVQIHDSMFVSTIIESLFSREFYNQTPRKVLVDERVERKKEKYEGGYVLEPTPGIFDGVGIFDFQSMFPSNMMALNVGIDTFIGNTKDNGKTYVDKDGRTQIFDKESMIYSASGTVFTKKYDSILRKSIGFLFGERVFAKHAGSSIDKEIAKLEKFKETLI